MATVGFQPDLSQPPVDRHGQVSKTPCLLQTSYRRWFR